MTDRIAEVLTELQHQRDRIDRAIVALNGEAKRRGRPPGSKNRKRKKGGGAKTGS